MLKLLKVGINLMVVCMLGGTLLAIANAITAPQIAKVEEDAKNLARQAVLPQAKEFKPLDEKGRFFKGLDDQKRLVGYVVLSLAEGYGGEFGVMVGLSLEFKVMTINILSTKETPGLGDKIKEDKFRCQFQGKGLNNLDVVKTATKDKIEAITGATISSRAVTEAVKEGIEELKRIAMLRS